MSLTHPLPSKIRRNRKAEAEPEMKRRSVLELERPLIFRPSSPFQINDLGARALTGYFTLLKLNLMRSDHPAGTKYQPELVIRTKLGIRTLSTSQNPSLFCSYDGQD